MKNFLSLFICLLFCSLFAEKIPSSEAFLNRMRSPAAETWGKMEGTVTHRKRGTRPVSAEIGFGALFLKSRTVARILFRGKELCTLTQSVHPPYDSFVKEETPSTLPEYGIRPGDLAMDFAFREMIRELDETRVKALVCRVFLLKGKNETESVRLYASRDYGFPLRVEWIGKEAKTPFRTLEVTGFQKVSGLWTVSEFTVFGPGWRTVVNFREDSLKAGLVSKGIPGDLFPKAPSSGTSGTSGH